jgi:hypothetical protein
MVNNKTKYVIYGVAVVFAVGFLIHKKTDWLVFNGESNEPVQSTKQQVAQQQQTPRPHYNDTRTTQEVVNDYALMHTNKEAAQKNVELSAELPALDKELSKATMSRDIAAAKYEELTYKIRLQELDEKGAEALRDTGVDSTNTVQQQPMRRVDSVNEEPKAPTLKKDKEYTRSDFTLMGISKNLGGSGYIAHLGLADRPAIDAADGEEVFGRYEVDIRSNRTVYLCVSQSDCQRVY